jgi:hypothetical protein
MRLELAAAAFVIFAGCLAPAVAQPAPEPTVEASAAWSPRDGEQLYFDVYRDGGKFGRHVVTFSRSGDRLTVASDIELKVAVGPVNFFHYVHKVTEQWSNGQLVSVNSRTKKDGKWTELSAQAADGGMRIAGSALNGVRPGIAIPSTHWNIAEMRGRSMLSTETGELLQIDVIDQGSDKVKTEAGLIDARRYLLKSNMDATFWYDASGRWVKCAFASQGSKIEYVLRGSTG